MAPVRVIVGSGERNSLARGRHRITRCGPRPEPKTALIAFGDSDRIVAHRMGNKDLDREQRRMANQLELTVEGTVR